MKSKNYLLFLSGCFFKSHHAFRPPSRPMQTEFAAPLRMNMMEDGPDKEAIKLEFLAKAANEARGLGMDAIAAAHSGYMSMPLGDAEIGAALFGDQVRRSICFLPVDTGKFSHLTSLHLVAFR